MIDAGIISYAVKFRDGLTLLQQSGISPDHFVDDYVKVWKYLLRMKRQHDSVPTADSLLVRFPELELPRVRRNELPMLLHNIKQRKKFIDLMIALNEIAGSDIDFENVDDAIQELQGRINTIAFSQSQSTHMRSLFSKDTQEYMLKEIKGRKEQVTVGIPTGLNRFDRENGGLQPQKMATIIARPGVGKSWLDLIFVANAVISGRSVVLYPLEMTLFETAARLYTLFSQRMFGANRVIKNLDIVSGKVTTKKIVRLFNALEDKFDGQLHVADISALADPYTIERIEAEVEMLRPDMFWVDYITLLKMPPGSREDKEHVGISRLSKGIKGIAMRRNVVGGASAQVNREAMRVRRLLPRLEHIAYGDSIGQDADLVFSINRKLKDDDHLYWALVKNRGGLEIPGMKVLWKPNVGIAHEVGEVAGED